ncbi:MAG TPA: PaaI family thioesterase [Candidatus Angelobacter sp.]|nr:PaaI family thioesterase [Candidatus Angelobacter sp.]
MESQAPTKQTVYGIIPSVEAKALSGYELMKRIQEGELPVPPIGKVFNFRLAEVEPGRAVFTGQPSFDYYNPIGSVHGGYAATLLDSCMGCAVHSTLPAGVGYTTLEIKVNFVRPILENTGMLRAEGKIISGGKRIGTAEGRVVDSEGRLYAHGTTTCLIFPL